MKKDNIVYIQYIVEAINKTLSYIDGMGFEEFVEDTLTQDAVLRNFTVVGEASGKLSKDFLEEHSAFPIHEAISTRNKVVHDYGDINLDIVWKTAMVDFPVLLTVCEKILNGSK